MTSCDTNIPLNACNLRSPVHTAARAFMLEHAEDTESAICELVLLELYVLLRNPTVVVHP